MKVRELLTPSKKLEVLSRNLSCDVFKLQSAIIKDNKHDIGTHMEAVAVRVSALAELLHDEKILREDQS